MPKILTIIVPCYNAEKTIHNALSSIDFHYKKYFNVLLIDDGSEKPLSESVNLWLRDHSDTVSIHRQKNTNGGGVINYAINNITTRYFKILDADDQFNKQHFGLYINYLHKCLKNNIDTIINSYKINCLSTHKEIVRHYNRSNFLKFTSFNKFYRHKLLTVHALTFSTNLLRKKCILPTNISYTDNILTYQTIALSKKICIMPRRTIMYVYNFGNEYQSMSGQKTSKNVNALINIYHGLLNIKLNNIKTNTIKSLTNVIKSILYFVILIISIDKNLYQGQKKIIYQKEINHLHNSAHLKQFRGRTKFGYSAFVNANNRKFIFLLNRLIFDISQSSYVKLYRQQFYLAKQ